MMFVVYILVRTGAYVATTCLRLKDTIPHMYPSQRYLWWSKGFVTRIRCKGRRHILLRSTRYGNLIHGNRPPEDKQNKNKEIKKVRDSHIS